MELMTDEQIRKAVFVEVDLTRALREATWGYVDYCEYKVDGPDETVIVKTVDGAGRYDTFGVNVTGDSRWAILKDVMKAVAKRYE